ncbi:MAG: hypothetical protein GOVbin631_18 [Prokaryotic dsDNA virus sp.]|nr:MAG: hypothetical protein GOVbin631_18 [Prokaryotic dsDNA virus sp.]|tara:strand:- start:3635 stop:4261 length:627 start_codon:yes stop_codon:yes gene_type:complete
MSAVFKNDYYTVTVAPAELPVTVSEFKEFAKISFDDEDALIAAYLQTATDLAEAYTGRWFVERTARGDFQTLLCTRLEQGPFIQINKSPLQSITSVETWNESTESYDAFTDYKLKDYITYPRLLFPNSFPDSSWWLHGTELPRPIRVTFVAGYGDASAVPQPIKIAIMMMSNALFEDRGDCECAESKGSVGGAARSLLAPYRILEVFA